VVRLVFDDELLKPAATQLDGSGSLATARPAPLTCDEPISCVTGERELASGSQVAKAELAQLLAEPRIVE